MVEALFDLAKSPDLQISLDAHKTLQYLFHAPTKHQDIESIVSDYLRKNTDFVYRKFNELIRSDNALNQRLFLNLLSEVLTKRRHFDLLMTYVTNKHNFSIAVKILTDKLVISLTDEKHHNLLIDTLLEELLYFEEAGDILQEFASRPGLADLLLNHTFITRLQEEERIDINDLREGMSWTSTLRYTALKQSSLTPTKLQQLNEEHKRQSSALVDSKSLSEPNIVSGSTGNASLSLPCLTAMTSSSSMYSNDGRTRTRYSGDDTPCFRRSPQHYNHHLNKRRKDEKEDDDDDDGEVEVERPLVLELISLINRSCSDLVANYSFRVLKLLLTTNREKAAIFLMQHYDEIIVKFRQLIRVQNSNKLRQKQFLGLLTELLLENANSKFRRKFKSQVTNLQIIMNLLKSDSEIIAYDAFHIFAVFVTSKRMTRDTHVILWKNVKQNHLIQFIEGLLPNVCRKYQGLNQEKLMVIEYLKKLPTPQSDESYRQLPLK